VIIGVHYEKRKDIVNKYGNKATFHFMVIVGKRCINGEEYYRFYDPGRGEASYGANELNLLKIDRIRGMIYNFYKDDKIIYTITEVRKNK